MASNKNDDSKIGEIPIIKPFMVDVKFAPLSRKYRVGKILFNTGVLFMILALIVMAPRKYDTTKPFLIITAISYLFLFAGMYVQNKAEKEILSKMSDEFPEDKEFMAIVDYEGFKKIGKVKRDEAKRLLEILHTKDIDEDEEEEGEEENEERGLLEF